MGTITLLLNRIKNFYQLFWTIHMNLRKCKLCPTWFESKNSKGRSLYCSPECRKEGKQISYAKWRANNPEKYKEYQQAQYKNRARDHRVKIKYAYRETPQPELNRCNRCGKWTVNIWNCKECTAILMRDISSEYPSPPMRGRGLKRAQSQRTGRGPGRPPCGGVD